MQQQHAYRNPELRIDGVARALNTNRTYLSAIIREHFETHFIGFVNRYRIAEAKELLSADNTLSILEISEQVGFKSISSFNLFFKKETGISPSRFRGKQSTKAHDVSSLNH
jgi:YesN/AraC family two-component response regulator